MLTAVLKTTASLLQKFLAEVYQMQSVQESNRNSPKADDSLLLWPQHVSGRTTHEKVQWVKEQLASVKESCEDILMKGISMRYYYWKKHSSNRCYSNDAIINVLI